MSMQDCACNKPTPAINGYKYAYDEVLSSFLVPLSSVLFHLSFFFFPLSSFLFPLASALVHRPCVTSPTVRRGPTSPTHPVRPRLHYRLLTLCPGAY